MPVFLTGSGVEQYGPYGNRGVTYYSYPGGAGSVSQLITYPSTGGHVVSFTPHVAHPILDREAVLQASVTPMALEYHPSRVRRGGGGGGGGGGGQSQAQSNPPAQKQQQAQSNPPAQQQQQQQQQQKQPARPAIPIGGYGNEDLAANQALADKVGYTFYEDPYTHESWYGRTPNDRIHLTTRGEDDALARMPNIPVATAQGVRGGMGGAIDGLLGWFGGGSRATTPASTATTAASAQPVRGGASGAIDGLLGSTAATSSAPAANQTLDGQMTRTNTAELNARQRRQDELFGTNLASTYDASYESTPGLDKSILWNSRTVDPALQAKLNSRTDTTPEVAYGSTPGAAGAVPAPAAAAASAGFNGPVAVVDPYTGETRSINPSPVVGGAGLTADFNARTNAILEEAARRKAYYQRQAGAELARTSEVPGTTGIGAQATYDSEHMPMAGVDIPGTTAAQARADYNAGRGQYYPEVGFQSNPVYVPVEDPLTAAQPNTTEVTTDVPSIVQTTLPGEVRTTVGAPVASAQPVYRSTPQPEYFPQRTATGWEAVLRGVPVSQLNTRPGAAAAARYYTQGGTPVTSPTSRLALPASSWQELLRRQYQLPPITLDGAMAPAAPLVNGVQIMP